MFCCCIVLAVPRPRFRATAWPAQAQLRCLRAAAALLRQTKLRHMHQTCPCQHMASICMSSSSGRTCVNSVTSWKSSQSLSPICVVWCTTHDLSAGSSSCTHSHSHVCQCRSDRSSDRSSICTPRYSSPRSRSRRELTRRAPGQVCIRHEAQRQRLVYVVVIRLAYPIPSQTW